MKLLMSVFIALNVWLYRVSGGRMMGRMGATGRTEIKWGKGGELGYLEWLARNHPGVFGSLYGKLIPFDVNAKVEEKPVVRYETVEERRAAMLARGWAPSVLAALEEAMEPKFLRDMREENEGQGEAN